MDVLKDKFTNWLNEKDRSENTIAAYLSDLGKVPFEEITTEHVAAYTQAMQDDGLAISTINRRLLSIAQYVKFLAEEEGKALAVKIRPIKQQRQNFLDDVLTEKDLESLLRAADKHEDKRAAAIFATLAYTGMRVSEMLQLTVEDVGRDTITINGKGSKRREVFMANKLQKVLREYLKDRKSEEQALFVGQRGPINRQTVDSIIKEYAGYTRLKKTKAHAHNFRHLFCKMALENGLDISTVADLAGHTDLNTTRIYTRKTKKELLDAIESIGSGTGNKKNGRKK